MTVQQLLGNLPLSEFLENFYLQQPYSQSGGAKAVGFHGWSSVEAIFRQEQVDWMLAREGELHQADGELSFEEVRRLHGEGFTLAIRHAERHDDALRALAQSFEESFAGPVNIHLYCTPERNYGFGWHYDAEDVFILQTEGSKEYSLRKNTVNPWPIVETIPENMRYDREIMPIMKCQLHPGDWLYIPTGYWHVGQSKEASLSLAIGVMSPVALDVFDYLRTKLLDSLRWRQRLPVLSKEQQTQPEFTEKLQTLFADLGRDMLKELSTETLVNEFTTHWRAWEKE